MKMKCVNPDCDSTGSISATGGATITGLEFATVTCGHCGELMKDVEEPESKEKDEDDAGT